MQWLFLPDRCMSFTPQNVCGFLIRSRLMNAEDMRNMFQRWLADARDNANNLNQFTKWLVANQYVTEYQANLLAKGHGDPDVYFLNQYKILDRIGRGRMAGVYKAMHTLGQTVAIKVLPPSRAKNPQMLARFQRERGWRFASSTPTWSAHFKLAKQMAFTIS